MTAISSDIGIVVPEFMLAVGGAVLMMAGVFAGDTWQRVVTWLAIALLLATTAVVIAYSTGGTAFNGAFISDEFARFAKILALLGAAVVLFIGQNYVERERLAHFEFP